jgi:hypothetical protein
LVLNVGAITPLVHQNEEFVGTAFVDIFRDIKLVRISRPLSISHEGSVDVQVVGAINAVESKPELGLGIPVCWDVKGSPISSDCIFGRDVRGADREGVLDVGVVGNTVALQLPVTGDLDCRPGYVRGMSGLHGLSCSRTVVKLPDTVE